MPSTGIYLTDSQYEKVRPYPSKIIQKLIDNHPNEIEKIKKELEKGDKKTR